MGVYIKGMEMPSDCDFCGFENTGYCSALLSYINVEEGIDTRCPLIEVKALHGRLIDADALLNQWCEDMCKPKPNCEEDCAVYDYVRLAPTVIEAEVE